MAVSRRVLRFQKSSQLIVDNGGPHCCRNRTPYTVSERLHTHEDVINNREGALHKICLQSNFLGVQGRKETAASIAD